MKKHGEKYDYSRVRYATAHVPVLIGCPVHGDFTQTPDKHLRGGLGCPKCGRAFSGNKRRISLKTAVKRGKRVHGERYEYLKIIHRHPLPTLLVFKCPRHGEVVQAAANHYNGNGCPKCRNLLSQEEFLQRCCKTHGDKYDYSKTVYTHGDNKITILCSQHGEFEQVARRHSEGSGCPKCFAYKGEEMIARWLQQHNIVFERQKTFDGCQNPDTGHALRFDFYLPGKGVLLECDGTQHYNPRAFYTSNRTAAASRFRSQRWRDYIKERYAAEHDIKLVRVPYRKPSRLPAQLKRVLSEVTP